MNRRDFLLTGSAMAFAGCLGGGDQGDPLEDHESTRAIHGQPSLGPPPTEATGLIVAFEDPSCPRCRAFEQDVVPTLRAELIEPGDVALVQRSYPVVYDWGEPATSALEATYDVDADAFWDLFDHYFAQQDDYRAAGVEEVYSRTRRFLSAETDVDGETVVSAAEAGEFDDAVRTDLDAGMDAGAGRTTPSLFLFRDGEYLTSVSGSISYEAIESALQL